MTSLPPTFTEETKRETERTECVEKYVSELLGYLRDWAIIEPELTLILGNVRRMMNDLYEKRRAETLKEVRELTAYAEHTNQCIRSHFEAGRPTKDGYEQKIKGVWYESQPVDRTPKCDCGLDEILTRLTQ